MGLVRSPEIWEMIEKSTVRIENDLSFLKKFLKSGEQVELRVLITSEAVTLDPRARIDIDVRYSDPSDSG